MHCCFNMRQDLRICFIFNCLRCSNKEIKNNQHQRLKIKFNKRKMLSFWTVSVLYSIAFYTFEKKNTYTAMFKIISNFMLGVFNPFEEKCFKRRWPSLYFYLIKHYFKQKQFKISHRLVFGTKNNSNNCISKCWLLFIFYQQLYCRKSVCSLKHTRLKLPKL